MLLYKPRYRIQTSALSYTAATLCRMKAEMGDRGDKMCTIIQHIRSSPLNARGVPSEFYENTSHDSSPHACSSFSFSHYCQLSPDQLLKDGFALRTIISSGWPLKMAINMYERPHITFLLGHGFR